MRQIVHIISRTKNLYTVLVSCMDSSCVLYGFAEITNLLHKAQSLRIQ